MLKQALQKEQMNKDYTEFLLTDELEYARNRFTNIYLAEIIVKALGDDAKNIKDEMDYFINANKLSEETRIKINNAIKEGLLSPEEAEGWSNEELEAWANMENPNQNLWKDGYDVDDL